MLINGAIIAVLTAGIVLGVGRVAFDVPLPTDWPLTIAVLVIGSASFAALGLALATFVPNVDAADPIAFGTLLPLLFISGVFDQVPADSILSDVATVFPVKHLFDAALATTDPGQGHAYLDLLFVACWGLAAVDNSAATHPHGNGPAELPLEHRRSNPTAVPPIRTHIRRISNTGTGPIYGGRTPATWRERGAPPTS